MFLLQQSYVFNRQVTFETMKVLFKYKLCYFVDIKPTSLWIISGWELTDEWCAGKQFRICRSRLLSGPYLAWQKFKETRLSFQRICHREWKYYHIAQFPLFAFTDMPIYTCLDSTLRDWLTPARRCNRKHGTNEKSIVSRKQHTSLLFNSQSVYWFSIKIEIWVLISCAGVTSAWCSDQQQWNDAVKRSVNEAKHYFLEILIFRNDIRFGTILNKANYPKGFVAYFYDVLPRMPFSPNEQRSGAWSLKKMTSLPTWYNPRRWWCTWIWTVFFSHWELAVRVFWSWLRIAFHEQRRVKLPFCVIDRLKGIPLLEVV